MPCVGTRVRKISKRIYRSIKVTKIIGAFETFGGLGQGANGKIMPQQDIINTNTRPLVAVQHHENCDVIWWSQSGVYNFIASHMPKHGKLSTSTAGLVIGLSTHHGILQREIMHIYLATLLSSRVWAHCLWLCSNKRKKLTITHGFQQNWCSLLCCICPLQGEVYLNTLTCTVWYLVNAE